MFGCAQAGGKEDSSGGGFGCVSSILFVAAAVAVLSSPNVASLAHLLRSAGQDASALFSATAAPAASGLRCSRLEAGGGWEAHRRGEHSLVGDALWRSTANEALEVFVDDVAYDWSEATGNLDQPLRHAAVLHVASTARRARVLPGALRSFFGGAMGGDGCASQQVLWLDGARLLTPKAARDAIDEHLEGVSGADQPTVVVVEHADKAPWLMQLRSYIDNEVVVVRDGAGIVGFKNIGFVLLTAILPEGECMSASLDAHVADDLGWHRHFAGRVAHTTRLC